MRKFFKNNKGFTMVELIIVIAIIAVLAAVLAPQYLRFVEDSREATDVDKAAQIETTLNVLIAADDIDYSATVADNTLTWTLSTGDLAFGSGLTGAAATETGFLSQLNASSADLIVTSVRANATAGDEVVFTVSQDTLGNPGVTVADGDGTALNYDIWAD